MTNKAQAFFYKCKGDSNPLTANFNGDEDESDFAMQMVKAAFPLAPSYLTAKYCAFGSIPMYVKVGAHLVAGTNLQFYWTAKGIKVRHAFGKRVGVKDKSGNNLLVNIGSDTGVEGLHNEITLNAKNARGFKLLHVDANKDVHQVTDENLPMCFKTGSIYVDFTQVSYSHTTDSILTKFNWPAGVDIKKPLTVFESLMCGCTSSAEEEANKFLDQIESMRLSPDSSEQRSALLWDECVSRATTALDDWSQTLEVLDCYNEATRRLLINEIVKQVSKYAGRTMLVEPFLCKDQKHPPAYFQGTGALDYLIGVGKATCIELYPTVHHAQAASTTPDEDLEDDDTDEDEEETQPEECAIRVEVQDGDHLSAILCSTDVEAKRRINIAALRQLLAQIYDKVYVAEEDIVRIANHKEETAVTAQNTKKRPATGSNIDEPPPRKFQKLTGVLTTGHTWKIFKFQFDANQMSDTEAKLHIEYAGHFALPVLGDEVGSGLNKPGNVDKKLVQSIMAALFTSARLYEQV